METENCAKIINNERISQSILITQNVNILEKNANVSEAIQV